MTELLSPAGSWEAMVAAVQSGADAVYMGFGSFNARRSAQNFSDESFAEAVRYCHLRGVKVYLTLNTLLTDRELTDAADALRKASQMGADAVLVQDWGALTLAQEVTPDLPIHASTQMSIHTLSGANYAVDLGMERVVLARELSRNDIAEICRGCRGEIETFLHGALCMCYSGQCEMSALIGGRSGNRGRCAQPCRLPFGVGKEKGYCLSLKDLSLIDKIPALEKAGVCSLKIEGRMKSAYYAAAVTNAYRHAIDCAVKGEPLPGVWLDEGNKLSHRPYCTGFYYGDPGQHYAEASYFSDAEVCAVVEECDGEGNAVLTQRNRFCTGDTVELMTNSAEPVSFTVGQMENSDGEPIEATPHPMMRIKMKLPFACEPLSILRRMK